MNKMINNSIQKIERKSLKSIKGGIEKNNNTFLAEVDDTNIKSWEDYASQIQKEFQFPTSCLDSIDRYLDWMRDLSWLEKEEYVLIINNYSKFLANNLNLKNEIISDFKEIILPFWEKEVEDVIYVEDINTAGTKTILLIHGWPGNHNLSDWIFQLGLQAAGWSTAAIAHTWLGEEGLFNDLKTINVPTLILHGINDQVCLFPLALSQKNSIKNSKLVPLEACGHFLFYDQRERFNRELIQFMEA